MGPFLVLYDYGQGGVWAILLAGSRSEIRNKFPELEIVEKRPQWMNESDLKQMEREMTFDVDDEESVFLASILAQRGESKGPQLSHG